MFVRLVVSKKDYQSHVEQGLFQAADILLFTGRLARHERTVLKEAFRWFNRHLPVPGRFARSRKRHAEAKAICWFKDSAGEFIGRMEELATFLVQHGYVVLRKTTYRPGYIVYEDEYQVAAEPFRGEM